MKLQDLKNIYNEALTTLAILGDFKRKDKKRLHLLEITSVQTLEYILGVKKNLENMGIHLIKN